MHSPSTNIALECREGAGAGEGGAQRGWYREHSLILGNVLCSCSCGINGYLYLHSAMLKNLVLDMILIPKPVALL